MPSFVTTDIIRYNNPDTKLSVKSHILHPHSDITIICVVSSAKENVTSVVEDHILENISSTEWRHGEENTDFSYITEKYNRFLSNLSASDAESVGIIFAIERDGRLMVSSIGESEIILQEDKEEATSIHEDTRGHHRFELISSGEIPINSSVFISSRSLDGIVSEGFYRDCGEQESKTFADITKEILLRDIHETTHLIRIRRTTPRTQREENLRGTHEKLRFITDKIRKLYSHFISNSRIRDFRQDLSEFFQRKQSIITMIFLVIGTILFFGLVSQVLSALFSVSNTSTQDAKNQILEAKNLLEASLKLTSNPSAFNTSIKNAENILSDLEAKQLYTKDVQEMRNKIEAVKKELYDIQVVDLNDRTSVIPFDNTKFQPLGVYESEKKLYLVGKEQLIWDYAIGEENMKIKEYPSGEIARDFAEIDDGNVYILTESNRIIASRKNTNISYVNVAGQDGWERSDGINVFNGNIYIWNRNVGQIYRHRPGLNGFSQGVNILGENQPGIVDIGIDGGFYILKDDQKILRIISGKSQSGLTLNKIPGEYTVGNQPEKTQVVVNPELNYIYILDGNRVWIFLPDSRRFQDVKSWTYMAQIELNTQGEIRSISVPRDGLFYVVTDLGVYDINFEVVKNKIIIRS